MAASLRVGIIGTGIHGSRYARHILADLPALALTAISRRSGKGREQAADWGCAYHADWRRLVADPEVASVVAVTTPDLHPAIVEACVRAGKPLLMEKPLASSVAAGETMVAAMAKAELPFCIAQTLRYNSVIRGLKRELHRVGKLHSFSANQRLEPSTHPWLEDPALAGGGVILHTAVHLFDALRFITGRELRRVRATAYKRHNPHLEDLFTAQIQLDGELVGTVDASKVGSSRAGRYEFVGEEGQLQGDQIHGSLEIITGAELRKLDVDPPGPTLIALLSDWERHLAGAGPNPIPASEGLAALRICEACALSAREEREVAP